jgi:hypothetical protein
MKTRKLATILIAFLYELQFTICRKGDRIRYSNIYKYLKSDNGTEEL